MSNTFASDKKTLAAAIQERAGGGQYVQIEIVIPEYNAVSKTKYYREFTLDGRTTMTIGNLLYDNLMTEGKKLLEESS